MVSSEQNLFSCGLDWAERCPREQRVCDALRDGSGVRSRRWTTGVESLGWCLALMGSYCPRALASMCALKATMSGGAVAQPRRLDYVAEDTGGFVVEAVSCCVLCATSAPSRFRARV